MSSQWRVFGGSARGGSHVAGDLPCQDYVSWYAVGSSLCLAVADGAGSRSHSAEGARVAVQAVLAWWRTRMVGGRLSRPLEEAFHVARSRVLAHAAQSGLDSEQLASTLAVAVADATSVRMGQLGDGIGVIAKASGKIEAVAPTERAEYVNETCFLTDDSWQADLRLTRYPVGAVSGLSLSTDGLQYKILADVRRQIPYVPFFRDLFAWAAEHEPSAEAVPGRPGRAGGPLQAYLEDLDDDQSDDDRTLAVAVREGAELITPLRPRMITKDEWIELQRSRSAKGRAWP